MPRPSVLLAIPLLAALAGCSRPVESGVVVSGRVNYLGKPLSNAAIAFVPDIDKPGRGGQAMIEDGRYTIGSEEGLMPGEFNILITPTTSMPDASPPPELQKIPERYRKLNELRVTVPARKSYEFNFVLKPDPQPVAVESPGAVH